MNTLGKHMTKRFITQEQFNELEKQWKALANFKEPSLTAFDNFLYQVLRGKDWRKAFVMPSNPKKVQDTKDRLHHPELYLMLYFVHQIAASNWANYKGQLQTVITKDMIKAIAEQLPTYDEVLDGFKTGNQIDAYKEIVAV